MFSGTPELWPSPWPGAPSIIGSCHADAGLLRGLRNIVDIGAERDHRLALAPGRHPGGGNARVIRARIWKPSFSRMPVRYFDVSNS